MSDNPFITGSLLAFATLLPSFAARPDFKTAVQPILEANCVRCHTESKIKGGLRIDTYEKLMEGGDTAEAVVPGKPSESELLLRIYLRPIDEGVMPDEGKALKPEDVAILDAWVESGAEWPKGVTLTERKPETPKRVAIPTRTPSSNADAATMLDDLLRRENTGTGVITTELIGDAAFLRRTTIDLIGRIPTMKEIREYQKWGEKRRAKLIAKLTSHARFADRWTIFMADMLRIRSNVTGGNQLLAYIHGSLDQGKPYDELVRELISASGRANSNPAVGYILGDDAAPMELAAATSQIFLGVRIGCAMCHDHPFDDWEQKHFYDLAAFFGKTKKMQSRRGGGVYTTEGDKMTVLWPPEDKADPDKRKPVKPKFPFQVAESGTTPQHIERFEAISLARAKKEAGGAESASLDALLDSVEPNVGKPGDPVLEEAKRESRLLKVHGDIYRSSELRTKLADLITDPRNDYFARAFVNRVWAELIGHGFVEPLDNFSDYNELHHPSTLDFLAQEFIASGYDLRSLVRIITLSDVYRRSALSADTDIELRKKSELNFTAAPSRRMISEVLYDSIVVAGHLEDFKWPKGANNKEVSREIRVPTGEYTILKADESQPVMMTEKEPMRDNGYDLESSLKINFGSILNSKEQTEIANMRMKSDEAIKAKEMAEKMAALMQKDKERRVMKYKTETITETFDDNPRFDSAMRMATPAPPAHFLRVFGQPARTGLGEFRDNASSLRQQLLMLNGRITNEASRVGTLEPIHRILKKDPDLAIDWAYQEILTRYPTDREKSDARSIVKNSEEGMADLRWALLNSNEFRFLP
ncbi:PSD1 and planctomycete cytochrome C domain-containing protein [Akkermansiaceae bacterium]|nr:PSD1 and planctomycete cytochrome C domain-containing protein [Akkermansiaceae bacterium]